MYLYLFHIFKEFTRRFTAIIINQKETDFTSIKWRKKRLLKLNLFPVFNSLI